MSHAQRPRQMTVARSIYLMANQKNKGKRTQKRATATKVTPQANPSARMNIVRPVGPRIRSVGDGLIVRNKEFFKAKSSNAGSLVVGRVGMNPADPNVFAWLSSISSRYAYYRWRSLRVMYSSSCPTTQRGLITMGLFYDREDLDAWYTFPSIRDLTQTTGATQGPVWGSTITCHPDGSHSSEIQVCVDVNRAHLRTPWHILDASTTSTALDNQAVAVFLGDVTDTNAASDGLNCGTIWFDYEIEFRHPTAATAEGALAYRATRAYDPTLDERAVVAGPPVVVKPPPKPASENEEDTW